MPKKHKPKWGWRDNEPYRFHYFSDEDSKEIAKVLDVLEISKAVRSQLQNITRNYFINRQFIPGRPRLAEVIAAVQVIHDQSKALKNSLERLDSVTKNLLLSSNPNLEFFDLPDGQSDIHKIFSAAEEVLKTLSQEKDKGGRPATKDALQLLIIGLKGIFEETTGSKASITFDPYKDKEEYQGFFYDFVYTFLKIIDAEEERGSNNSLGQQIKKSLKLAKTSPAWDGELINTISQTDPTKE